MKLRILLLICLAGWASAAVGQTPSRPPTATTQPPSTAGSAGVKTRLETLHYRNVRDLRRGPDGQWTGKATQGNVPKTVTVAPNGTVTAR